jgi:hypothetical protein
VISSHVTDVHVSALNLVLVLFVLVLATATDLE